MKAKNVLIAPIKAVLFDLNDMSVDYILCSSEMDVRKYTQNNILGLSFADTIEEKHHMRFTKEHAEQIVSFISRTQANDDIFICCDSGESRSSALAAALILYKGEDDLYIWQSTEYHPNRLVFKVMCQTLGIAISDSDILSRIRINDSAFHNAIINGTRNRS